jgi:hypothetical protein
VQKDFCNNIGTQRHKPMLAGCPQPTEADIRPLDRNSRFDPSPTLAVHFGNGFDAGFSPYQSALLSRYNAGR